MIRKAFVNTRSGLLCFLVALIIVLTGVSLFYYRQNQNYRRQNEELIIRNDSVLSVNIELRNALLQKILPGKTAGLKVKGK